MPRQYSIFMEHIIRVLLPYFCLTTTNLDAAAAEIVETLDSYGVRTRAEFIKATQIIALSMVTLETLAESNSPDLSPSLRIRYRGCANGLNRSTIQCEKALERRLASDIPGKPANEPVTGTGKPAGGTPEPANDAAEPVNDMPDEDAIAAIAEARAQFDSYRNSLPGQRPPTGKLPHPDHPAWAAAIMDVIKQGAAQVNASLGG
jgi:hypothetical protein